jgi:transcriptional regulator with XRE-family HTH domain
MTIEKATGRELAFWRTKKGLSQEKLGFEADLHRTHISLIERGLRSPTISTVVRLCASLEIEPDKFIKLVMQRVSGKRK